MARISGVNVPDNKQIETALTYIYGIGRSLSNKILKIANVNPASTNKDAATIVRMSDLFIPKITIMV